MSQRINYTQAAAKLDYAALNQKLERLSQAEPPSSRNTAQAMLEPLREKLLALHRDGWSAQQLATELKAAGVPATVARLRECLQLWNRGSHTTKIKPRPPTTATPNPTGRNKSLTGGPTSDFKVREL